MSTTKRYTGTLAPDACIALHTDPWLQDAETGERVDLRPFEPTEPRPLKFDDCDCIAWAIVPGIFAPSNDQYGIQLHDECDVFPGDFEAAEAIAEHVTAITGRTYEIWYEETILTMHPLPSPTE